MLGETTRSDWKPEPALYTISQASAYLNVSERTIRNLLQNGELAGRRIGRRMLIPFSSLKHFLKQDHVTQRRDRNG